MLLETCFICEVLGLFYSELLDSKFFSVFQFDGLFVMLCL